MAQDPVPLIPMHNGRTFLCYRDVNKAIDHHRELYGLKLTLKKATKLENYPLTAEQQQSINFRLKYGELHYACSIDNGRVGRPGNDEKCHLLVCLNLSPDGRTLVVQQTHIHEYSDKKGYGKAVNIPITHPTTSQSSPQQFTNFSALPSPSAFAASIAAAAAAAAGHSPLSLQQQATLTQSQPTGLVGLPPNTSLTILPHQLAASLAAAAAASSHNLPMQAPHPNITIRNIAGAGHGSNKTSPPAPPIATGPLPGQLIIPSFYSSKSPAGNITFSATGARKSPAQQVFNNASVRMLTATTSVQQQYASQGFSNANVPVHSRLGSSINTNSNTPAAQEKLTMKLKKSQFSPNEMVVVGSVRDAREQQDLRKVDKSTPKTTHGKKGSSGGRINAVVANLLNKVVNNSNNSLSVTHVMAPVAKTAPSQSLTSNDITITYEQPAMTNLAAASHHHTLMTAIARGPAMTATKTSSANRNVGGVMSSKGSIAIEKPKAVASTAGHNVDIDQNSLKRLHEKIRAKKAHKAAMKVKVKVKPLSLLRTKQAARPVGRPLGSTKANRLAGRLNPPIQQVRGTGGSAGTTSEPRVPNKPGRPPGSLMDRKVRQCRQRAPGPTATSPNNPPPLVDCPDKLLPIDTELGEHSKQRVAQRVLVQLLRTCTQLPMVEFSHAMDTIVTLTDALRLKHRVQLSIHHDQDDNDGAFALLGASGDDDLSRQFDYGDTAALPGSADGEADQPHQDGDTDDVSILREGPTDDTKEEKEIAPPEIELGDDIIRPAHEKGPDARTDSKCDLELLGNKEIDSYTGDEDSLTDSQAARTAKRKSSENDLSEVEKRMRTN